MRSAFSRVSRVTSRSSAPVPLAPSSGPIRRSIARSAVALAALAGLTLLPSGDAKASGYLTARFGADDGTPAMPNTYAIYFNPAALGGTTGTTMTGDVSLLLRWAQYRRGDDALSPSDQASLNDPTYKGSNTGKGNLLNLLALPYAGVNTDFGGSKIFRAGYAVYIPFGGFAQWDKRPQFGGVPGTVDGATRWHNISGQILAVYNTLAFAVKVHPRFTIGASLSGVIHQVATVRARNADGSDDTLSATGQLIEGRSLLDVSGFNFGVAGGLYWEPTDNLRLGLSYTSSPGLGTTKMTGELTTQIAATQPGAPSDVDFYQTYPDLWRFGAAGRIGEKWELRGDFEFVRWSVFDRQCVTKKDAPCDVNAQGAAPTGSTNVVLNVPRNWMNAIGVRVGPSYALTEDVELFGSLGMTTPAVPSTTIDASTIDALRLYGTAGAKFKVSKHLTLGTSYNHIFFFDRNTDGGSIQNIPSNPATSPGGGDYNASRSPSADGRYKSQIGFVNINAAYTF